MIKMTQSLKKKISLHIQKIYRLHPTLKKILSALAHGGGVPLLVGGAVRDLFFKIPLKDIDIEVHNLSIEALESLLKKFGHVRKVGKSFGVLRIDGLNIDWSLPRIDTSGRKPEVIVDPHMGFKKALSRRDLTINAMAINLLTQELIDPFNGLQDLKDGVLRSPDYTFFKEDPLRFFRIMQFIGRFSMYPDKKLQNICATMDISTVSKERIEEEFSKLFLKSATPSQAIRWLDKIKRLAEILPELATTKKIKQSKQWHPEGNVFEHTMQSLDAAARIILPDDQKLILMWAALCHDLGKITTTRIRQGKITSYGHELESERLTKKMLKGIMNNKAIINTVCKLVRYHMQPLVLVNSKAKISAYKRLALKLTPETNLQMLAMLATVDHQGRNPQGIPFKAIPKNISVFIKKSQSSGSARQAEEPILKGRDVQGIVPPGPAMGKLLKKAYEIQIEEDIQDKDELKKRIIESK